MLTNMVYRKGEKWNARNARAAQRENVKRENAIRAKVAFVHDFIYGAVYEADETFYAGGKVYRIQEQAEIPGDVIEKPLGYQRLTA